MEILSWLQEWYSKQCDGDWEHGNGIKITTIDNPGWYVTVSLNGTHFEEIRVDVVQVDRTDEDWIYCKIEDGCFTGAGGPGNLEEILNTFHKWVTFE
ncbi:immunity 53 family protein [Paenibacillus assamensis]|uniref:immunity 53 family protein n=1 Tax=Paenibacillus assamensis TaxID=311244 RepID=UPI000400A1C7|nr:immunity 53 family protein [Paenibacillus assamensis]